MANWDDYKKIFSETYKGNSLESYRSYANKIEELYRQTNYNQSIGALINNAIINKKNDPVDWLLKKINIELLLMPIGDSKKRSSYRCGFKKFAAVVFGVFYANTWMSLVTDDDVLCSIVAQNALFASKEVVEKVRHFELGDKYIKEARSVQNHNNPFASWDYMTRYRNTKKKRKKSK